jgi:hypothetical protein
LGELGGRTSLKWKGEEGKKKMSGRKKRVKKTGELRRKAGRRGKRINEWR